MSEKLVAVPRAHVAKYHPMSWADVVAAAERGDDGLSIVDSAD